MGFKIGKFYQHESGRKIYICGCVNSLTYGLTFIAERSDDRFYAVGMKPENAVNWHEITQDDYYNKEV